MTDYITLQSKDGRDFKVPTEVSKMSKTVQNLIEDVDFGANKSIPLPEVSGEILSKVIEYMTYHSENPSDTIDSPWDMEFCKVDQATLFAMILAANYLDVNGLLDLACRTVADMVKGKTPEEIRATFNIVNDFTPEEERQVLAENEWCQE